MSNFSILSGWLEHLRTNYLRVLFGLLFAVSTVVATLIASGYGIGYEDHDIHLTFLARAMDPNFLRGDLLADAASTHASLFWIAQVPIVKVFGLDFTYFVAHIVSIALMIFGTYRIASLLASSLRRSWVASLACIPAIITSQTFGGIKTFDALVLNRTVALGPELLALVLALEGRAVLSLFVIGLAANIHVTTASHTAVVAFAIIACKPNRWKLLSQGCLAFLVGALPIIIMMLTRSHHSAGAYAIWEDAVVRHFPFHHFIKWMGAGQFFALGIPIAVVVVNIQQTRSKELAAGSAAIVGLCAANVVLTDVLHMRIGVMLHLYESTRILNYLAFASAANLIVSAIGSKVRLTASIFLMLALLWDGFQLQSLMTQPFVQETLPFIVILACSLVLLVAKSSTIVAISELFSEWRSGILAGAALGLAVATGVHILRTPMAFFAVHLSDASHNANLCRMEVQGKTGEPDMVHSDREVCGFELMDWARANLPANAKVVLPPYFMHSLAGFRFRAQRSAIVTFKDGGESTFDSTFAAEWTERLDATSGPLADQSGAATGWQVFIMRLSALHMNYGFADREHFVNIAKRYGATHVICTESQMCANAGFKVVYSDGVFRILALPSVEQTH